MTEPSVDEARHALDAHLGRQRVVAGPHEETLGNAFDKVVNGVLKDYLHTYGWVSHSLGTYEWLKEQVPRLVERVPTQNVVVPSRHSPQCHVYFFRSASVGLPSAEDVDGYDSQLEPHEAQFRRQNYVAPVFADVFHFVLSTETRELLHPATINRRQKIGVVPVMLGSSLCVREHYCHGTPGERTDQKGYFIVQGVDKYFVSALDKRPNRIFVFREAKGKVAVTAEMRPRNPQRFRSCSTLWADIERATNTVRVVLPFTDRKCGVPAFAYLRALGFRTRLEAARCIAAAGMVSGQVKLPDELRRGRRGSGTGGGDADLLTYQQAVEARGWWWGGPAGVQEVLAMLEAEMRLPIPRNRRHVCGTAMPDFETRNEEQTIEWIAQFVNPSDDLPLYEKVLDIKGKIVAELFPHVAVKHSEAAMRLKRRMFAYLLWTMVQVHHGRMAPDSRDDMAIHYVETAALRILIRLSQLLKKMLKRINDAIMKRAAAGQVIAMNELVQQHSFAYPLMASMRNGNFADSKNAEVYGMAELTQALKRQNGVSSHRDLRCVKRNSPKTNKNVEPRLIMHNALGWVCPLNTPDNPNAGLLLNLPLTTTVSAGASVAALHRGIRWAPLLDDAAPDAGGRPWMVPTAGLRWRDGSMSTLTAACPQSESDADLQLLRRLFPGVYQIGATAPAAATSHAAAGPCLCLSCDDRRRVLVSNRGGNWYEREVNFPADQTAPPTLASYVKTPSRACHPGGLRMSWYFVNGVPVGLVPDDPARVALGARLQRRRGEASRHLSVHWDGTRREVAVFDDVGGLRRPVIPVDLDGEATTLRRFWGCAAAAVEQAAEEGQACDDTAAAARFLRRLTADDVDKTADDAPGCRARTSGLLRLLEQRQLLEWMSPLEEATLHVRPSAHQPAVEDGVDHPPVYSHSYLHARAEYSDALQSSPLCDRNNPSRVNFGCSMQRGAKSFSIDPMLRFVSMSLVSAHRPLATTWAVPEMLLDSLGAYSHNLSTLVFSDRQNMEDAVILNQDACDRGLGWCHTVFTTSAAIHANAAIQHLGRMQKVQKETLKERARFWNASAANPEDAAAKDTPATDARLRGEALGRPPKECLGRLHADYSCIDEDGLPRMQDRITPNHVLIGRTAVANDPRTSYGKHGATTEEAVALLRRQEAVRSGGGGGGGGGDDEPLTVVRDNSVTPQIVFAGGAEVTRVMETDVTRKHRAVVVQYGQLLSPRPGWKMSTVEGQKVTVGRLVRGYEAPLMPDGTAPTIMMNSHSLHARETMAFGPTGIAGVVGAGQCRPVELSMLSPKVPRAVQADAFSTWQRYPWMSTGETTVLSPNTGAPVRQPVGNLNKVFMWLKQMGQDKIQCRRVGKTHGFTKQPTKGKSRNGGHRLGYMEKDCIMAQGAPQVVHERMCLSSDPHPAPVCANCGLFVDVRSQRAVVHGGGTGSAPGQGGDEWGDEANIGRPFCANCGTSAHVYNVMVPYSLKILSRYMMGAMYAPRLCLEPDVSVQEATNGGAGLRPAPTAYVRDALLRDSSALGRARSRRRTRAAGAAAVGYKRSAYAHTVVSPAGRPANPPSPSYGGPASPAYGPLAGYVGDTTSPSYAPLSPASGGYIGGEHASPAYVPHSPVLRGHSGADERVFPAYAPTSPVLAGHGVSGAEEHVFPAYTPTSPVLGGQSGAEEHVFPAYTPTSPVLAGHGGAEEHVFPAYTPTSPVLGGQSVSGADEHASPAYVPTSPVGLPPPSRNPYDMGEPQG